MDKMVLRGMEYYGYHGVFAEERKLGQRFYVDLETGWICGRREPATICRKR